MPAFCKCLDAALGGPAGAHDFPLLGQEPCLPSTLLPDLSILPDLHQAAGRP